jgi:type I restriction-modification system DNA methylase subunit
MATATRTKVAAAGMVKAAELLAREYTLVVTNVPYLGRGKQCDALKRYCDKHHADAKADLATCFVDRCLAFCATGGMSALVTPSGWLSLKTYESLRRSLLKAERWVLLARLGPRAFETISGEVVNVTLVILNHSRPDAHQDVCHFNCFSQPRFLPDFRQGLKRLKGLDMGLPAPHHRAKCI